MSSADKKKGMIVQAGVLATAGLISRIIGMLYNSPLTIIIGDEGNGYYSSAYNLYTIVLLVSSYSIPSAISKVIAQRLALKQYKNAQRLFHCALLYVAIVGGIASLFLFFGAPLLVKENSARVVRVFAPTIFAYGFLGVLRGYFQAHHSMVQTSFSQIIEQILNATVSLGAAHFLMQLVADQDGTTQAIYGAMGSAIGTGSGVLIALLIMFIIYRVNVPVINKRIARDRTKQEESYGRIFREIIFIVTPFILSTFIYNFTTFLDQKTFTDILVDIKGFAEKDVLIHYGVFNKKAMVMVNIPTALASAMSAAIMPSMSAALAKEDFHQAREKVALAIRVTMLISIPSAVGLFVLAKPLIWILYPQQATIDLAAGLLRVLAITVIFYSLSTLTMAVIQGCGRVNVPVLHSAVALVIQLGVLIALLLYTDLDVYALCIACIVYSLLMCLMNGHSLAKILNYSQEWSKTFIRPACCSAIMGLVAFGSYEGILKLTDMSTVSLLVAVVVAVPTYFCLMVSTKGVTEDELRSMPKGYLLVKLCKKVRLM